MEIIQSPVFVQISNRDDINIQRRKKRTWKVLLA